MESASSLARAPFCKPIGELMACNKFVMSMLNLKLCKVAHSPSAEGIFMNNWLHLAVTIVAADSFA